MQHLQMKEIQLGNLGNFKAFFEDSIWHNSNL